MTRHFVFFTLLAATPAFAGDKPGMPQMDPTWIASQLFWLYLLFMVLYLVVSRSIVPKVEHVLRSRSSTLSENLRLAERMSQDANAARIQLERVLAESQRESEAMLAAVQAEAKAAFDAESQALDARLKYQLQEAEALIAKKLTAAEQAIGPAAASLAAEITGKLLGQKIDAVHIDKHIAKA